MGGGAFFAIQDDGTLWYWGRTWGGPGTQSQNEYIFNPTKINNDTDWKQVGVGNDHAMGIKTDGSLWAIWGFNESGQLGFSDRSYKYPRALQTPRRIGTDTDWAMAEGGFQHTIIMKTDGSLWACGNNNTDSFKNGRSLYGLLSVNPKTEGYELTDVFVTDVRPVRSVLVSTECNDSFTVEDLKAVGQNILWHSNSVTPDPLPLNTPLVDGTRYFASQTLTTCLSYPRMFSDVSIVPLPKPLGTQGSTSGSETQTFCPGATVANLVASGANIKWYDVSTGGSPLLPTTPLANGTHYYASQTFYGCESGSRLDVIPSIGPPPMPTGITSQRFCTGGYVKDIVVTGTNINWYSTPSGGSPLPSTAALVDNTHYYATQSPNGCESTLRFAVVIFIGTQPPTGNAAQSLCYNVTLNDIKVTGTSIKWYSAATGGSLLSASSSVVDGKHYYASQTLDGCESALRLDVAVSVGTPQPTGNATQSSCFGSTIADLVATGNDIRWYDTGVGSNALPATTPLVDGKTYYATQTINDCESNSWLSVLVKVGIPSPTASNQENFCTGTTVNDLTANGTAIKWYSSLTGGAALETTTPLQSGTIYYASQTIDGCESKRTQVKANIVQPGTPVGEALQTLCASATVASLVASGANSLVWYDSETGGIVLDASTTLVNGTSYYASEALGNCISPRLKVTVTITDQITPPTGNATQIVAQGKKISDLVVLGQNIKWYSSLINATQGINTLPLSMVLTNNTTYYATQTLSSCESPPLAVTVVFDLTQGP